jgi:hypothetical protein
MKLEKNLITQRIQKIVDKHVEALAQEIGTELARPMIEEIINKLRTAPGPSSTSIVQHEPSNEDGTASSASARFNFQKHTWTCPLCETFVNKERRSVTTHMRHCRDSRAATRAAAAIPRIASYG